MFLFNCLRAFGPAGIWIYFKLKFGLTKKITLARSGVKVFLRPGTADEYTFREIFIRREYDIRLPENFKPRWIVDAGANIGLTSVFFSTRFPDATILSIEPDIANFERLALNATSVATIIPLHAALWHNEESVQIADEGYGIRGFTIKPAGQSGTVTGISIPSLMHKYKIPGIDILKMDIEGSEKEIFESGYENWLPKTKCLVIELHDRMKKGCSQAVLRAVSQYNFSLEIKGENLVFFNEDYRLIH